MLPHRFSQDAMLLNINKLLSRTNFITVLTESSFDLKANVPKIMNLKAGENTTLILDDFPGDTSYIVCQAHSQTSQLTLSTLAEFNDSYSVSGLDVGVVSILKDQSNMTWYLRLDSEVDTRVMVHVTVLTANGKLL